MRKLILCAMILGWVFEVAEVGMALADPEQGKPAPASMTTAELEKTADGFRAQKDYKEAIRIFRIAVRKDPKNALLFNKLGMSELQLGDTKAAHSDFDRAVKLDRKYTDALNNLGAVNFIEKRYERAARQFKKALALEESRATFHVNLGAAWFAQNKLDRAIAEYSRAMELDPSVLNTNSRVGVASQISSSEERAKYAYVLAKIYAKRKDYDRCLESLKKAKEEGYPDLVSVYKDDTFSELWQDARLAQLIPPPRPR